MLECELKVPQTHFLVLLRVSLDCSRIHPEAGLSKQRAVGRLGGQLVALPLLNFRTDRIAYHCVMVRPRWVNRQGGRRWERVS